MEVEVLFRKVDLSSALRAVAAKAADAVASLPRDVVLGDVEEAVKRLVEDYSVEPVDVDVNGVTVSHEETRVDVSQDFQRAVFDRTRPCYMPATAVHYHVPFSGNAELFTAQPDYCDFNPPRGTVRGTELVLTYTAFGSDLSETKREFMAEIGRVQRSVESANRMVQAHNANLLAVVGQAVVARQQRLRETEQGVAALGFPVRGS